jgi:hypothetical protein
MVHIISTIKIIFYTIWKYSNATIAVGAYTDMDLIANFDSAVAYLSSYYGTVQLYDAGGGIVFSPPPVFCA